MTDFSRRHFVQALLATGAVGGAAALGLRARGGGQTVVVGGGPAGASAALALRLADPRSPVTLIERDPTRLVQTGAAQTEAGQTDASLPLLAALSRPEAGADWARLAKAGVSVVLDDVVGVDGGAARLSLFSGRDLAFDRLVLAPGTAARPEPIAGLDAVARHRWPAAWGNRAEARRLAAQLAALPARGHLVLRLPAGEVSHPQVALARALTLARHLAHHHPQARFSVLDGSDSPTLGVRFADLAARQGLGAVAWLRPGAGGRVLAVDARAGRIETDAGVIRADVVNFVPPHAAGAVARLAGLVDASGWCPCDAQSRPVLRLSGFDGELRVLGDARKGVERSLAAAALPLRGAGAMTQG